MSHSFALAFFELIFCKSESSYICSVLDYLLTTHGFIQSLVHLFLYELLLKCLAFFQPALLSAVGSAWNDDRLVAISLDT